MTRVAAATAPLHPPISKGIGAFQRQMAVIFGQSISVRQTRRFLQTFEGSAALTFLNATIKVMGDARQKRTSRLYPEKPLEGLMHFCGSHFQDWNAAEIMGDEAIKAVFIILLDNFFPVGRQATLAAPGEKPAEVSPAARLLAAFKVDPRSLIFGQRMLAGLEKGYFTEMFGEPVAVVRIESVGDKHLCLEVDDLSPMALMGVVHPANLSVSATIRYWRNRIGIPEKASQSVEFEGQPMDAQFTSDKMDEAGVAIAAQLVGDNEAVIDSTKLIVFKGKTSGRIYKIIYKGFEPIKLEKAVSWLLEKLDLPQYKISPAKDQFGAFGWIEYCEHHALDADNIRELMGENNIYKFGQYFGWCYVLGIFDFTGENFFIRKSPDSSVLTRFDHETAFPVPAGAPYGPYFEYILSGLHSGMKFPATFGEIVTGNLQRYCEGVAFVVKHFEIAGDDRDFGKTLSGLVKDALVAKGVRRRHLFQSTRYYLQGKRVGQLQGVVPYYSTPVDNLSIMCLAQRIESLKAELRGT